MKLKQLLQKKGLSVRNIVLLAVILGVYTALMALIPITKDTSFADITISFEVWILFGVIIIMNSSSPKDSALKCFLFFLVSQPIVYLLQVPFSLMKWEIFNYYKYWFVWTILTIPMGFLGFYLKKNKWWGLVILFPILVFLGFHYSNFLKEMLFIFPRHLLSTIFCFLSMLFYPFYIFQNKLLRKCGCVISVLIIICMTIYSLSNRISYSTDILASGGSMNVLFDDSYKVYFEDSSMGMVSIKYDDGLNDYLVFADFKKGGNTNMILEDENGVKTVFKLRVGYNSYDIDLKD